MTKSSKKQSDTVATNRKALRDYTVLDKLEAGIELLGTEIKSLRTGEVSLVGAYVLIDRGQAILHDMHIAPYEFGNQFNHKTTRPRRLLLHKKEITKMDAQIAQKGYTVIPLRVYFVRGRAKVQIGICKGKVTHDKRDTIKKRDTDRDIRRAMKRK